MEKSINYYKHIAKELKKKLDTEFGGTWNVVVGSDFGCFISYDRSHLMFFKMNEINFLIFRFGHDEPQSSIAKK